MAAAWFGGLLLEDRYGRRCVVPGGASGGRRGDAACGRHAADGAGARDVRGGRAAPAGGLAAIDRAARRGAGAGEKPRTGGAAAQPRRAGRDPCGCCRRSGWLRRRDDDDARRGAGPIGARRLAGDAAAQAERSAIGAVHAGIVRQKANADPVAASAYLDAHAPEIGDPQQVAELRTMLQPYLEEQEADRVVDTLRSGGAEGSRSAADDLTALLAQIDALNLPPRQAETARQRLIQQVGIETRMRTDDQREAADQVWAIVMDPKNTSISAIPPELLARLAPGEQAEVIAALRRNGQPDPAPDPVLSLELSIKAADGTLTQADLRRAWGRVPMADWERAANWLRLIERRPQPAEGLPSVAAIEPRGEAAYAVPASQAIRVVDRGVPRAEYDAAVARSRAAGPAQRSPQEAPRRYRMTDGPTPGASSDNVVSTWQEGARFYGDQFGFYQGNPDGTATFVRLHPDDDTSDEATAEQPYVRTAGDWTRYHNLFIPPAPQQRMPWEYISYAGRNYPTVAAAQAAGMPTISNGPTEAELERAARDRAFISSIGQGPFGLGPIAYVMGASAENIGLSNQFDQALGGIAGARAMRPNGSVALPGPGRPGVSVLLPQARERGTSRTFSSPDPLVGNLANEIEALYPGHVTGLNMPVRNAAGLLVTDADIQLRNAIIQVKSGGGKGLTRQVILTEQATGMPTIGYGLTLKPSVVKSIERAGGLVTTNKNTLLEVVKP